MEIQAKPVNVQAGYRVWSWKARVENPLAELTRYYLEVQFLDQKGFELHYANDLGTLAPGESSLTGQTIIPQHLSPKIKTVAAEIRGYSSTP